MIAMTALKDIYKGSNKNKSNTDTAVRVYQIIPGAISTGISGQITESEEG